MANKTMTVVVRMSEDLVAQVDAAVGKLPEGTRASRSEAVRWLVEMGLMVIDEMEDSQP